MPTQRVAAICLFDENGATRPEVVHLVRSIALQRRVSWVTLENVGELMMVHSALKQKPAAE